MRVAPALLASLLALVIACAPLGREGDLGPGSFLDAGLTTDAGSVNGRDGGAVPPAACPGDEPMSEARTQVALASAGGWSDESLLEGVSVLGTVSLEARPDSEVVVLTVVGSSTLSLEVFPAPPVAGGDLVTLQLSSVRLRSAGGPAPVRQLDEYVLELRDAAGDRIAAYWGRTQWGGQGLEARVQLAFEGLTIEYRSSGCELVPWWGFECGDVRYADLWVESPEAQAMRVPAGAIIEFADDHIVGNNPRSFFELVNPQPCSHVPRRSVSGFLLRVR